MQDCEIEKEVMTSRKWIEFGKMYNNLSAAGINLYMENRSFNDCLITMYDTDTGFEYTSYGINPYETIHKIYFDKFLDMTESVNLDMSENELHTLYEAADKEGITIDEFVTKVLSEFINIEDNKTPNVKPDTSDEYKTTKGACCYNCIYLYDENEFDSECEYLGNKISVHYGEVCPNFEMFQIDN